MSNIVAMIMARNEEWILEASIKAARKLCDKIVVFDHASTDRTREIALSCADGVDGTTDPVWREMDYRQQMFELTAGLKPTHLAFIDADEIVTNNCVASYRKAIENLTPGQVAIAPMVPVWRTLDQYRKDASVWSTAGISLAVGYKADLNWKPRAHDGYQHHAREPKGMTERVPIGQRYQGGVMHLQFACHRRLKAKHTFYKMMERITTHKPSDIIERQYNQAMDETGINYEPLPKSWWDPEVKALIDLDHVPWHEKQCQEYLDKYGRKYFGGLNLFGVV
ncbi:MAG: glycosyltransferase family 2 protein [Deltaproteobacteria bacterium]|nr:glycosyltransferase family 2 protein [Deltaproteobacteria bacterium]